MARSWYKQRPGEMLSDLRYRALPPMARLIYRELLDLLWLNECALPDDPALLADAVGIGREEFERCWELIQRPSAPSFEPHPEREGMITHPRLLREWKAAEEAARRARERRRRRREEADKDPGGSGPPRRNRKNRRAAHDDTAPQTPREDGPAPDGTRDPEKVLAFPLEPDGGDSPRRASRNKGRGIPPCPHEEIVELYHEILPELPRVRIWNEPRRRLLQARWREDPERQNLDWWRKYFKSVKDCPFLLGKVDPGPGRQPFRADLEWLVRPTNLPKVLEGRYEPVEPEDPYKAFVEEGEREDRERELQRRRKAEGAL